MNLMVPGMVVIEAAGCADEWLLADARATSNGHGGSNMNAHLRFCNSVKGKHTDKQPPESYPFPSVAASQLTRSGPKFGLVNPFPFPYTHPENERSDRPAPRARTKARSDGGGQTMDPIMGALAAVDQLQHGLDTMKDEIETYQFPEEADDRPFAA